MTSYKQRPVPGLLGCIFLLGCLALIMARGITAETTASDWIRLVAYLVPLLLFIAMDFRKPAALVKDGTLSIFTSSWKPGKHLSLDDISEVKVFSKHFGFTMKSGQYLAFPLRRFTSSSRAAFLEDLVRFRESASWPPRRAA